MGSYQINLNVLLRQIQDVISIFSQKRAETRKAHGGWNFEHDVRLVVFTICRNALNNAHIGMACLTLYVSEKQWWSDVGGKSISTEDLDTTTSHFETFIRVGFISCLMTAAETCFRCILRATDPGACHNGTDAFKNIYESVLSGAGLRKWITLLDLFRTVRNTIHNNGVYFHRSGNGQSIRYNGILYDFVIGSKMEFITWELLLSITTDMAEMLYELVNAPQIASVTAIIEPGQI